MSTIKFITNLPQDRSPWKFNISDLDAVPNTPGVYIVGVKIPIDGQCEKFCPFYIGLTKNLRKRLTGHQQKGEANGQGHFNKEQELFDFVNNTIFQVYQDIHWWNLCHWNLKLFRDYGFYKILYPNKVRKDFQKLIMYSAIESSANTMIYFNCKSFFDYYLKSPFKSNYIANGGHEDAIKDLKKNKSSDLENKIIEVKNQITSNYFFVYSTQSSWETCDRDLTLDDVEDYTKLALEKINIFTHGKMRVKNVQGSPIVKAPIIKSGISVDINSFKEHLVNITNTDIPSEIIT